MLEQLEDARDHQATGRCLHQWANTTGFSLKTAGVTELVASLFLKSPSLLKIKHGPSGSRPSDPEASGPQKGGGRAVSLTWVKPDRGSLPNLPYGSFAALLIKQGSPLEDFASCRNILRHSSVQGNVVTNRPVTGGRTSCWL